jgi:putative endonuclease
MLYTVYILFSKNHTKIYIGYTSNLIVRFHSHNTRSKKGWTYNFRPWIVIYCEYFADKADTREREKQLKGATGREWIWKKIETELGTKGFISA